MTATFMSASETGQQARSEITLSIKQFFGKAF
jgi:hypothetical protein